MLVSSLETRGFRNLDDDEIAIRRGITILHGPNGAGKTNLLEALYFGLTASSFRSGPDRDLIAFEQRAARIELELEGPSGRRHALLAALDRGGERRHLLDGRPPAPASERPPAAVFHPDRLALLKGPPAHRRAHLDRFISALWPARADLRQRFGKTLAQRNALASRVRTGEAPLDSLAVWDERLAAEAAPLIAARAEATSELESRFAERAAALGLEEAAIAYRPRAEPDAEAIAGRLSELRAADLGRAYLAFGPQLDEVVVSTVERALRRFGSQGQQRTALLALLFCERDALLAAGRPAPIMLLDDVMSELDPAHRELLVAELTGAGQALVTATEAAQVPAGSEASRIAVAAGSLRSLAAAA